MQSEFNPYRAESMNYQLGLIKASTRVGSVY